MSSHSSTPSEVELSPSELIQEVVKANEIDPSKHSQADPELNPTRERKLTEKGKAYQLELLKRKRAAAYTSLSKKLQDAIVILEHSTRLEILEIERDALDVQKDEFNQAHMAYEELLDSQEDQEASYHWFDRRDREFQECRMRICEKIQALERKSNERSTVKSLRSESVTSKSTRSSLLSSASAHSRKVKAAAKAAKLEAQMQFLDQEAEAKKLRITKELAMANAERNAMKALEEEEQAAAARQRSMDARLRSIKTEETRRPVTPEQLGLPLRSERSLPPVKSELASSIVKSESPHGASTNPFYPSPWIPQTEETRSPSASEAALQEIVRLQAKQTELSALITEHQKLSTLPVQEPPVFSGDFFDYPIFMRAFEAIIESRVKEDKERLYFLNKYTSEKANDAVKVFVTQSSGNGYERAKKLLAERFGDPYRVSEAYKSRLRKWPTISEGDSSGLQLFSDFLGQCEEAMKSLQYMNDLDSTEVLKEVSCKLPSYSGVKWCRHAFEAKQKHGRAVLFHDLVKFVKTEADLATDPVFSPDALKAQRKKEPTTAKGNSVIRRRPAPVTSNTLATSSRQTSRNAKPNTERKFSEQSRSCELCSASHPLQDCEGFKKKSLEERHSFIMTNKLCFGCLSKGHMSKDCRRRLTCQKCNRSHPTVLHREREEQTSDVNQAVSNCSSASSQSSKDKDVTNCLIVPVWLHHGDRPEQEIMVYALLDDASDTTFVKSDTLRKLGLQGPEVQLSLSTMLGKERISVERITGLIVRRFDKRVEIELPKTYSRSSIPFRRDQIPEPEVANKWPHLRRIAEKLQPHQGEVDVGLLIGCNCPKAIKPREVILGKGDDPYAIKTLLGWGIVGPVAAKQDIKEESGEEIDVASCNRIMTREIGSDLPTNVSFVSQVQIKEEVNPNTVKKMFEIDFSERRTTRQPLSQQDRKFLAIMEQGIHLCEDGHYELPLPLRESSTNLPNNREVAVRRLYQLKKRFTTDQKYRDDYTTFMSNVIKNGYAEKVPPKNGSQKEEAGTSNTSQLGNEQIWYIPHHGVYHPKKPNKIRVVFDCSAEFRGETLNNNLLQGPDLTNNLTGVLCRFRKEPIAVMCDIEAMFHQVRVSEHHRDLLRFLWWEEGDTSKEPAEFRMTVHLFGATSSPGCANYALKASADDNEDQLGSAPASFVREDFYVDDGLKSVASAEEATALIQSTKEMCKRGGFNLHKFTSNSREVIEAIPINDRAEEIKKVDLDLDKLPMERALGVQWCAQSDSFGFQVALKDRPCTRRGILSTVSSIFDPLGFVAPVLLEGKSILQDLCRCGVDWDDPIPEAIKARWLKWKTELPLIEHLAVPRCYKPKDFGHVVKKELHHFSDASVKGYGQCTYLRLKDDKGRIHCSLVLGKARVTPLKLVTIPRLELTAAVVSAKVSEQLRRDLQYEEIEEVFWTDSKVVLGYIANESRRFHVFVANRVQQIQEATSLDQWRYVETKENPADIASRGASVRELLRSKWIKGPDFLWQNEDEWPAAMQTQDQEENATRPSKDDPDVRKVVTMTTATAPLEANLIDRMEYYSDWFRTRKSVALCRRYIQILRERVQSRMELTRDEKGPLKKKASTGSESPVTVDEMQAAETVLIKAAQAITFVKEIQTLNSNQETKEGNASQRRSTPKSSTPLSKLDPFLDESGILRVGGRLRRADLEDSIKFPILLPRKGHVTKLIVRHFHEVTKHQGRTTTLNEARSSGYWIVGGTSSVSEYIFNCVKCRKIRGSTQTQKMADLPEDRLQPAPPFTYCAVDYFGPWIVKEKRKEMKRYGALFTCMTSRAIHLEVCHSLATDSFINALRRFICRRGPIRQLRSDQGTNFVGARKELKEALAELDQKKIAQELLRNNCDWINFKMNVPSASHMEESGNDRSEVSATCSPHCWTIVVPSWMTNPSARSCVKLKPL